MNSLLFVHIENETEKLSGHVDLTARWRQKKRFYSKSVSWFSGYSLRTSSRTWLVLNSLYQAKETWHTSSQHLKYKLADTLQFYSWQKNKLRHGKSDNWRLHGDGASLSLEHLATGARYCAVPRLGGNSAPWIHLDTKEKLIKIHCLDIKLKWSCYVIKSLLCFVSFYLKWN